MEFCKKDEVFDYQITRLTRRVCKLAVYRSKLKKHDSAERSVITCSKRLRLFVGFATEVSRKSRTERVKEKERLREEKKGIKKDRRFSLSLSEDRYAFLAHRERFSCWFVLDEISDSSWQVISKLRASLSLSLSLSLFSSFSCLRYPTCPSLTASLHSYRAHLFHHFSKHLEISLGFTAN